MLGRVPTLYSHPFLRLQVGFGSSVSAAAPTRPVLRRGVSTFFVPKTRAVASGWRPVGVACPGACASTTRGTCGFSPRWRWTQSPVSLVSFFGQVQAARTFTTNASESTSVSALLPNNMAETGASSTAPCVGMSQDEKFLFDLNGFIIVRGILSAEQVAAANAAIDAHAGDICERHGKVRNTVAGSPLSGDGTSGRRDLGGLLEWPSPHSTVFRDLLAHPKLIPFLVELCGEGYRMDHLPFVILQSKGSEGFQMHGGPITGNGKFNPVLQYRCEGGEFFNSLVAMSVQLSDHNSGDGGFCVVRGSHKMKFPMPQAFKDGESYREHVYQPATKAGDVVFFSEATVHGALPWEADHERRIALYRFAPPTCAYGRSYAPQWPAAMLEGLTPLQRAVLEPPYAVRLDRPLVRAGEEDVAIESRAEAKKAFDREIFKTQYF